MANVLPNEAQKHVWRLYRARFILAIAAALSALAIVLALALLPSYLAITLAAPNTSENEKKTERTPTDPIAVARAQALMVQLMPVVFATTSPTSLIKRVIGERPAGVALDHISYTAGKDDSPGEMMLVGTAARENISLYRTALSADNSFTSVSVPVAALVGTEGGHFSITLSGLF